MTEHKDRGTAPTSRVLAALAVVTAVLLAFPQVVPNSVGHLGSLLESLLPWLGLVVVVLFGLALLRRSTTALLALLLPVAAWTYQFGGLLLPDTTQSGTRSDAHADAHELIVVQHNVSDENADPAGTARALAAAEPDLIALEELVPSALPAYEKTLGRAFPYHAVQGTVGLWSKHPLTDARTVDIKPREIKETWQRGLRAVVHAPHGDIATYVAHLPSIRIGASGLASARRDESARLLGKAIADEKQQAVILMGDLNSTVDDRGLTPLTTQLTVPQRGFAFTFPAALPLARIDQVMTRAATIDRLHTLPPTGSDHLPLTARIVPD